tara:strand:- start:385 stop:801 length:417 start_codon:yes stop_codon:yes gene_type:complete
MKSKLLVLLILIGLSGQAQHLIGYKTSEIIEYFASQDDKKPSEKEPNYGKTSSEIPYIFFITSLGSLTYYISTEDKCFLYVSTYNDYKNLNYVVELMNKNFIEMGENKWMHYDKSGTYDLTLMREDEFFSVVWSTHKL